MTLVSGLARVGDRGLDGDRAYALLDASAAEMRETAEALTLAGFGTAVSYSRNVFLPLTRLCRDSCRYCTFVRTPSQVASAYLPLEEVLDVARAGQAAGCSEALFTLGDRPELRYRAARDALAAAGADSTLELLERAARAVFAETGLLPHINAGVMGRADIERLRPFAASMGLMLESAADRLMAPGGPHHGCPDKAPAQRLATIEAAGEAGVAFTTGLLIGIGETRAERITALLAIAQAHRRHGHIQEVIVQNFRAKAATRMAEAPEPSREDLLWTVAAARLILGAAMSIQAPPNLQAGGLDACLQHGANDWGGISPVTVDHVNPEAAWPSVETLAAATAAAGRTLVERTALIPAFAPTPERWTVPSIATAIRQRVDGDGLCREPGWTAGSGASFPIRPRQRVSAGSRGPLAQALARSAGGGTLREAEIVALLAAQTSSTSSPCAAADQMRRRQVGAQVTYVINRNINYTNICNYRCGFCAFSKSAVDDVARDKPYVIDPEAVAAQAVEAAAAGATEVCLQGGIHPSFDGGTYLSIVAAVRAAVPRMHIHAFSPLEITHGAATSGVTLEAYLRTLKAAGLATLPGTAAEILSDDVRQVICPDKIDAAAWLEVVATAHRVGIRTTATIMFGHVERPRHIAIHLLRIAEQQRRSGGFTEFVPLPFVHDRTPIWLKGGARAGPTARETLLVHAVARLVLGGSIPNLQASWVKLGLDGAGACLDAGVNDLGGVLMNESITRAAGGRHGRSVSEADMRATIAAAGRPARRRDTLYGHAA